MKLRRIFCLLTLAVAVADAPADTVRTLEGKTWNGDATLENNGAIAITLLAGTVVRVPLGNVLEATFSTPNAPATSPTTSTGDNWVPSPWKSENVGSVGALGTAAYLGGVFTLNGSGADIGGNADAFHFVSQTMRVDGDLIARVASLQTNDPAAKVGIMMRESLLGTARHAALAVTTSNGLLFLRRVTTGSDTKQTLLKDVRLPCWVKLSRSGNRVSGYLSQDGEKWNLVGTETIELPPAVRVGLVVTSHNNVQLAKATFDNVSIGYGAPPPDAVPRGVVTRGGSIITGTIVAADDTAVKLTVNRKQISISTVDAARLLFNPLAEDKSGRIQPGRTGVLLATGDFFDGQFKGLENGRVKISSVLFGVRNFVASNEVAAVVLGDVVAGGSQYEVKTRDGSVLQGKSLGVQPDSLIVVDPALGPFRVSFRDVSEIHRKMPTASR